MKNITLLLLISLIITSCGSDNLTNSKAKDIINKCLEEKPDQRFATIKTGEVLVDPSSKTSMEKVEVYKKLEQEGYLTFTLTNKKNAIYTGAKFYNLSLSEKASKYINQSKKNGDYVMLKSFRYVVDEVIEVQEIPAFNGAKVKVKYKAIDISPFVILPSGTVRENYTKTLDFKKTNNGWKYCD